MPTDVQIDVRLATEQDSRDVLRVLDELGQEINRVAGYSPHNAEAQSVGGAIYNQVLQREDTRIFLAFYEEEVVGVATLYVLPSLRHGRYRGHIEDLVVSEKVRGKGVGSQLLEAVKAYCCANDMRVLKLHSSNELSEAHRFYEKHSGRQTEKLFRFDL